MKVFSCYRLFFLFLLGLASAKASAEGRSDVCGDVSGDRRRHVQRHMDRHGDFSAYTFSTRSDSDL
jgi:hypothetical protein